MAQEGWALQRVGFATYYFERTEPGEYVVRLECRKKDEGYVSFVTDMGAEYVGRIAMWVYFRRKAELGEFELNGDLDSRIEQLTKIGRMLLLVGIGNLLIGLSNLRYNGLGGINLICAGVLAYAYGRIQGKKDELQRTSSSGSASSTSRGRIGSSHLFLKEKVLPKELHSGYAAFAAYPIILNEFLFLRRFFLFV